ncbi:MAG: hypothetical protein ABIB79_04450 [archaeon]
MKRNYSMARRMAPYLATAAAFFSPTGLEARADDTFPIREETKQNLVQHEKEIKREYNKKVESVETHFNGSIKGGLYTESEQAETLKNIRDLDAYCNTHKLELPKRIDSLRSDLRRSEYFFDVGTPELEKKLRKEGYSVIVEPQWGLCESPLTWLYGSMALGVVAFGLGKLKRRVLG